MEQPEPFRTVQGRCAVVLGELAPRVSMAAVAAALAEHGCRILEGEEATDPVAEARALLGRATYRRGARMREAPETVDCSSLVKWSFGRCGISLPRLSVQQRRCGRPVPPAALRAGDLLFTTGGRNWYEHDPADGVGHVYLATGAGTLLHADRRDRTVVEEPLEEVFGRCPERQLRGCRRILPDRPWRTLEIPAELEIESADHLRWKVLAWTWRG